MLPDKTHLAINTDSGQAVVEAIGARELRFDDRLPLTVHVTPSAVTLDGIQRALSWVGAESELSSSQADKGQAGRENDENPHAFILRLSEGTSLCCATWFDASNEKSPTGLACGLS